MPKLKKGRHFIWFYSSNIRRIFIYQNPNDDVSQITRFITHEFIHKLLHEKINWKACCQWDIIEYGPFGYHSNSPSGVGICDS